MLATIRQKMSLNSQHHFADASVLLAITDEKQPHLVLTKRATHLNKHAGEISFAGGKRESSDSDNIMVALRESEEEIGLRQQDVHIIGDLPSQKSKYGLTVQPIVGIIPPNYPFQVQADEIECILLISIQDFLDAEVVPYRIQYAGAMYRVPSFQLQGEIIWGLTGRMIVDFMRQVFDYDKIWKMPM